MSMGAVGLRTTGLRSTRRDTTGALVDPCRSGVCDRQGERLVGPLTHVNCGTLYRKGVRGQEVRVSVSTPESPGDTRAGHGGSGVEDRESQAQSKSEEKGHGNPSAGAGGFEPYHFGACLDSCNSCPTK